MSGPPKPILVFPGGMPRSLEFLARCASAGQAVVGASSLDYDVARERYPAWTRLPYITDPAFDAALAAALREFDIGGVFSPNAVVWHHLRAVLPRVAPGVALVNASPVEAELGGFRAARARAGDMLAAPLPIASAVAMKPPLPAVELAALLRHAAQVPGMCDDEKLQALCEIARACPDGDVVEIGSWWGKSAFILARLAHCHGIGRLLCVDPWSNEHLVQQDAAGLVDAGSALMDADEALAVFEMNLLPYNQGHVNYLRMPSVAGADHYARHRSAATAAFGTTGYRGRIALLHIDGNHSLEAARADVAAWSGFVVPGGWIVVDDYNWPYGDGPRRAGDAYLARQAGQVEVAFVMGGALFMQRAAS